MINCVILDDKPEEIEIIVNTIMNDNRFKLLGVTNNLNEFTNYINQFDVHLAFMDVEIGSSNALDYYNSIKSRLPIIVVSSYPKYAVSAFHEEALHFVEKPVRQEHVFTGLERAYRRIGLDDKSKEHKSCFLKTGKSRYVQLYFDQITHVLAEGEYLKIHFKDDKKTMLVYQRLKNFINELPQNRFIQIHRSCIINLDYIKRVEGKSVFLIDDKELSIGLNYEHNLMKFIE